MLPTFLRRLADPSIRTVLLCGCGGGFDFVHGLALYPELVRRGKTVVIGSYSFGDPDALDRDAPVVFESPPAVVRRVTAAADHARSYAPEVHVCSFLDERFPTSAPHSVLAYNSRDFDVPTGVAPDHGRSSRGRMGSSAEGAPRGIAHACRSPGHRLEARVRGLERFGELPRTR